MKMVFIACFIGITLVYYGCSENKSLEAALNAIESNADPADWKLELSKDPKDLEKYRSKRGLPINGIKPYPDDGFETISGMLALNFSVWHEWDSALEFSQLALSQTQDPAAVRAIIKAAIYSDNAATRKSIQNLKGVSKDSLGYIDILIFEKKYTEALTNLSKKEHYTQVVNDPVGWLQICERYLQIAERKHDLALFQQRLAQIWEVFFVTEVGFDACLINLRSREATATQQAVAFVMRDLFIQAYHACKQLNEGQEARRWQTRAKLLGEALVQLNSDNTSHWERVILQELAIAPTDTTERQPTSSDGALGE